MRRFVPLPAALVAATLMAAGCSDAIQTLSPNQLQEKEEDSQAVPGSRNIVDGTTDSPDANPYFVFLNPFLKQQLKNKDLGTFDRTLEPTVSICPLVSWDPAVQACAPEPGEPPEVVEYSFEPDAFGDRVEVNRSGKKYQVVWKSQNYPLPVGRTHRVTVSVYGQALGWADMAVYDPDNPDHAPGPGDFTADDVLLLNGSENQNISFRIDEGALEQEFCDTSTVEDCDVAIIDPATGGILRVFDEGVALGALADVPAGILGPDGLPYPNPFPAVLELEFNSTPQPGFTIPAERQVPYFADFWTPVPGLYFDQGAQGAQGVGVTVCQEQTSTDVGYIPEYLHDFLVLFLVRSGPDGPITELLPTTVGAEECEGFVPHDHQAAAADTDAGLFSRFAFSLSKVARLLLPEPLYAKRRLHGGLNTVVWELSKEGKGGGDAVAAQISPVTTTQTSAEVLEFGAVLNVDGEATSAAVTVPATGTSGDPTTIKVTVLDALNKPFLFEVGVTLEITGANPQTLTATYLGTGAYQATYTPTTPGEDTIEIHLEQEPYLSPTTLGPFTSTVSPVGPSASNTTFQVSYSEEDSPTTVTVTVLDDKGSAYLYGETFPIQVAVTVENGETVLYEIQAEDDDGEGNFDGIYEASFTPDAYGTYAVSVLIEGKATGDSPRTLTTAPRPADAGGSQIQVDDGQVQSATPVAVLVKNTAGDPYTYGDIRPISVDVTVSGANSATFSAFDGDLDGTYEGSYTPTNPGTDSLDAVITDATDDTVDDRGVPGATSKVAPLSGPLTVEIQVSGPAAAYVYDLPVQLYDATGAPAAEGQVLTNGTGSATFSNVPYGAQYTVNLPKRDFDVQFPEYDQTVTFSQTSPPVVFSGTSQSLPTSVRVWRVGDGGNGNAYEYTVGGRSWTAADNQVRDYSQLTVPGHLATITSVGENLFIAKIFTDNPDLCPNANQCKQKGWIGLYDQSFSEVGDYVWVTAPDEVYTLPEDFGWPEKGGIREEPEDRKGNENYVEIDADGDWTITNGASTTNEGFFTEWDVPPIPGPFGDPT